jgi:protocatechuate 3,4-dioxygenase beta subunit
MKDTIQQELPVHLRDRRFPSKQDRRQFLATMGLGGLFFTSRGTFAQALVQTPAQTLGPYYPDRLPLDQDNDLLVINDSITPAVGEISWITGRILDNSGQPLRGALVEIWQADNGGAYIHSASPITPRDANFQGYGRFITGSDGRYLFRTVKPGLYPGRTRHVHYQVTAPGRAPFVTQLYVEGEPRNSSDGILNGIQNAAQRASVIVPWVPVPGSQIAELAAKFDIVLGFTPPEIPTPSRPTLVSMSGVAHGATSYPGAAPGAWVTLFGEGLSASTRTWGPSDFVNNRLPESLDGVSVQINNKPAAVYYISPKQINVLAAGDVAVGSVQVAVTNANGTSDPVTVEAAKFLPGFFRFPDDHVAAVRADGVYLGPPGLIEGVTTVPAQPGDSVLLFGTGFGPTVPSAPEGEVFQEAFPLVNRVSIRIDTTAVDVSFAGLVSPGLYQFNVTVPDLADGDHAISAEIAGVRTPIIAKLRIQRQTNASATIRTETKLARQVLLELMKHVRPA